MFSTLHLDARNHADILVAANILRAGGLVAFATETVYGLGADALSPRAVAGIFLAKQRPAWDPLIVHLASADLLPGLVALDAAVAGRVDALAKAFWPGPLTLLLPRLPAVPDAVTAGRRLVGVRVPAHPGALALLRAAALPIAAPSANRFGHTSPTTAAHVASDLDGRIEAILDAGPTVIGLESTVLDPTQTPMVLYRPGAVTPAQLSAVTGVAVSIHEPELSAGKPPESLPSPGVGIRHYAPRACLILTKGSPEALASAAQRQQGSTGVLLPLGWEVTANAVAEPWADWRDPDQLAARLFAGLRALDEHAVETILCPMPDPGGLRDAIRDRLSKAARPQH